MDVEQLDRVLLIGAAVLLVAIAAVRLASRTGLPSLLLYVGLGVLLGEDVVGIQFNNAELAQALGYAALIVILAEGGLTTSWSVIRRSVPAAAALSTVGVAVSVVVTGVAARYLLDVSWQLALLLGAIVSSTDAAAVFSVLRTLGLRPRLVGILEAESGFNDAPVVILVVALSTADAFAAADVWGLAGLHASGFLAVYVATLWLGNARLPHRGDTRGFAEGLAWLAQIGLFIMLGLLVTPRHLGSAILPALGIGLVLLLVARPLSVLVSTTPFRLPLREQAFVSWAGLRGAVPIVLATVPTVEGVDADRRLFNVVFVLVVVYTLLQAPSLPSLARRLRVAAPAEARSLDLDAAPLDRLDAEVLQLRIPPDSKMHGVEVFELRLPAGANVALIVREGKSIVPGPTTMLRHGDDLLVVTPASQRVATEQRVRAVSEYGRLAGWRPRPPPRRRR